MGSKIGAQIFATTATLNDAWRNELITLNLPNEVLNKLWLETSFFGAFLLLKRFTASLEEEERKLVNKAVREAWVFLISDVVFEEGKNSDLKNYIIAKYDRTLEMYQNYKDVDAKTLFCDLLKDAFNSSKDSKMKFIENSFWNRFKLKSAFFLAALGGSKEFMDQHRHEVYLPNENLTAFATSAAQAFAGVGESDIRS